MPPSRQFGASYQALLGRIIRGLERAQIPYMIVGGLAAAYHGIPRATFDIDLVLAVETARVGGVVSLLRRLGFDLSLREAKLLLRVSNVIQTFSREGVRLDLWLPRSDYDRTALGRRRRTTLWPGQNGWIASAEDTILSKLIAGRTKDFDDARGILKVQASQLEWNYLTVWAKTLGVTKELTRVSAKQA